MSSSALERCKILTEELVQQPLNQYFVAPVDPEGDGLLDYFDKISRPMDYKTISDKLKSGSYSSPSEWYSDVCLIYENAMKYHDPDKVYHWIASHCLKTFKKMAAGLEIETMRDWQASFDVQLRKMTKVLSQSPVPQGLDPLIIDIVEKSKKAHNLPSGSLENTFNKINDLMRNNNECKKDVITLLEKTQSKVQVDDGDIKIKTDDLPDQTLNALYLYARAH